MVKYTLKRKKNKNTLKKRDKRIKRTKRTKRTKRYKRRKMGGHPNENLPHWHLYIKLPNGQTKEMYELFERTGTGNDYQVNSGTVGDIYDYVEDEIGNSKPFTLYWNGKKIDDRSRKLRQIMVDGIKIPLYNDSNKTPIVVKYNDEVPPEFVEPHDLDLDDLRSPQTPR